MCILLVEDEPGLAELVKRSLRRIYPGLNLYHMADGAEAMDYIERILADNEEDEPEIPRLILLDLNLPKISGMDVLKRIRGNVNLEMIPVVIFSSSTREEDIKAAYLHKANSYISKPLDYNQYLRGLKRIIEYWVFGEVASY